MNLLMLLAVGVGGGCGAIVRFLVAQLCRGVVPGYEGLGTLLVNVLGSLVTGFLVGTGATHRWLTPEWRGFLVVGLLGGLTTFSSLAWETVLLSRPSGVSETGAVWWGATHAGLNLTLGVLAILLGEALARWFVPAT